jgi:sec-independent protein translocase protein TatC
VKRRNKVTSGDQTLLDHVRELQKRLIATVAVFVVGSVIGYLLFEQIVDILRAPLGQELYYSTPAGSLGFIVKICTMVGVAFALPTLVYNIMMFLRPAFGRAMSIKQAYFLAAGSVVLAFSGIAFGYYLIIPGALHFFAGFQFNGLTALITADSYLSFVTNVIITFIIVFQIPLLMLLIDRIKPLTPKKLFASEKYVILAGLIISLFMPFAFDLSTSLLIALPIIVLYNISIFVIIWQHNYSKRRQYIESHNLAAELEIDNAIIDEMLNLKEDIPTEYKSVRRVESLSVKRVGMEISKSRVGSKSSRKTIESMQREVTERRARIELERKARLNALPKVFSVISDFRK